MEKINRIEILKEFLRLSKRGIIADYYEPSKEYGKFFVTRKGIKVISNKDGSFVLNEEEFVNWLFKNGLDLFDEEDED